MSKRLYEATLLRLRATATEALAAIERELESPGANSDTILLHLKILTECETGMTALQGYIGPRYAPPPTPVPAPPQEAPLVVTPEMSPTYAASVEKTEEVKDKLLDRKPKKGKKKK